MILMQEYHSLSEIDEEFRSSVSTLLKDEFPNFEAAQLFEQSHSDDTHFHYYLFFCDQHNLPIGIAGLKLIPLAPEKYLNCFQRFMYYFFRDTNGVRRAEWVIGSGSQGLLLINPKYWRKAFDEIQKIIFNFEDRKDILTQIRLEPEHQNKFTTQWDPMGSENTKKKFYLQPLLKRENSYQDYLLTLSPQMQKTTKAAWKTIYNNPELDISEDDSSLSFNKNGASIMKLPYLVGCDGRMFIELDWSQNPEINLFLQVQYGLMKFYDSPVAKALIFTQNNVVPHQNSLEYYNFFNELGFGIAILNSHYLSRKKYDRPKRKN